MAPRTRSRCTWDSERARGLAGRVSPKQTHQSSNTPGEGRADTNTLNWGLLGKCSIWGLLCPEFRQPWGGLGGHLRRCGRRIDVPLEQMKSQMNSHCLSLLAQLWALSFHASVSSNAKWGQSLLSPCHREDLTQDHVWPCEGCCVWRTCTRVSAACAHSSCEITSVCVAQP